MTILRYAEELGAVIGWWLLRHPIEVCAGLTIWLVVTLVWSAYRLAVASKRGGGPR